MHTYLLVHEVPVTFLVLLEQALASLVLILHQWAKVMLVT